MFDEIHYLRDTERGVVWEESIVLAPKTARFAFLSATIPNAQEFTQWIAKTHRWACAQQWEMLRLSAGGSRLKTPSKGFRHKVL